MKRISRAVIVATLTGTFAATAFAASPFPWSGRGDTYSQYDVFPGMPTYQSQHRAPEASHAAVAYSSLSSASAFPASAPEEASMADEGLVPGIAGVAPFVAPGHDGAVGAAD